MFIYVYIIYIATPALAVLLLDTRGATHEDWKALPICDIRDIPSFCVH